MRIHLIAIGGSIMHNLAMALQKGGHRVTGSDDEIYEPSRSRLKSFGLLPEKMGWHPSDITSDIDIIILGMHARADNPELRKALELGLSVMSFPEFVYNASQQKKRIVVAGSHGKTSTTSMIMHALRKAGKDFDYLVGALIPGFELMVKLSDAPVIVVEGDEYLSSTIDRRPKIFHYRPHVTAVTGVAWDHRNVFPTKENYVRQFVEYLDTIPASGKCFLYRGDYTLQELGAQASDRLDIEYYDGLPYEGSTVVWRGEEYPMEVFGRHNFENMHAAMLICMGEGIHPEEFLSSMSDFSGADMRLQVLHEDESNVVYRDFAHAPSKVRSTVEAVKEFMPDRPFAAFLELHTFSSLSQDFIREYKGSMKMADRAVVFYSPHTVEMKKLEKLSKEDVANAFGGDVIVCDSSDSLLDEFSLAENGVHLWMSSGRFGGIDLEGLYVD